MLQDLPWQTRHQLCGDGIAYGNLHVIRKPVAKPAFVVKLVVFVALAGKHPVVRVLEKMRERGVTGRYPQKPAHFFPDAGELIAEPVMISGNVDFFRLDGQSEPTPGEKKSSRPGAYHRAGTSGSIR